MTFWKRGIVFYINLSYQIDIIHCWYITFQALHHLPAMLETCANFMVSTIQKFNMAVDENLEMVWFQLIDSLSKKNMLKF